MSATWTLVIVVRNKGHVCSGIYVTYIRLKPLPAVPHMGLIVLCLLTLFPVQVTQCQIVDRLLFMYSANVRGAAAICKALF